MPGHLEAARQAIEEQLASLRQEVQQLEAAHAALDGGSRSPQRPGRPRGGARAATRRKTTRRRRSSGGPTRADQTYALVEANPGITIPELAERMAIKQNYLYRVLPGLQSAKKVTKRGKGWHSTTSS